MHRNRRIFQCTSSVEAKSGSRITGTVLENSCNVYWNTITVYDVLIYPLP